MPSSCAAPLRVCHSVDGAASQTLAPIISATTAMRCFIELLSKPLRRCAGGVLRSAVAQVPPRVKMRGQLQLIEVIGVGRELAERFVVADDIGGMDRGQRAERIFLRSRVRTPRAGPVASGGTARLQRWDRRVPHNSRRNPPTSAWVTPVYSRSASAKVTRPKSRPGKRLVEAVRQSRRHDEQPNVVQQPGGEAFVDGLMAFDFGLGNAHRIFAHGETVRPERIDIHGLAEGRRREVA